MADLTSTHIKTETPKALGSKPALRQWLEWIFVYGLLIVFGIVVGVPFVYMVSGSFKTDAQLFSVPIDLFVYNPTLENYRTLLSGETIPFVQQFGNSVFVSLSQTTLSLLFASMVGWGFAKYEFWGKRPLFLFLLATLAMPGWVTLVPLFLLMVQLGWLNSYLAIIIPGSISAFGSFFMRQSMVSVPNELLDAARIDGASEWGIFWRVGLPLSRGALTVLAVLTFLGVWNDYLWPVIVLRDPTKFTAPVGLATLSSLYRTQYAIILAGTVLVTLPILLLFVAGRKELLNNLTIGAIKQ